MKIFYFTATGNSLQVAKELGGELFSIPSVLKSNQQRFKDSVIGFVFPVYFSNVPKIVLRFLEQVELQADYFFTVVTHGRFAFNTLRDFSSQASKRGIKIDYVNHIQMVDTYVKMFDINNELRIIHKRDVSGHLHIINNEIRIRKRLYARINPFNYLVSKVSACIPNHNICNDFSLTDDCVKCGICIDVCPQNNISIISEITFGTNCISCLACTHNCPHNAIRVKGERSKSRYRNSSVSLKEIISSNK